MTAPHCQICIHGTSDNLGHELESFDVSNGIRFSVGGYDVTWNIVNEKLSATVNTQSTIPNFDSRRTKFS